MKIETTEWRRVKDGFRQDEAIGDDDSDIGPKRCELVLDICAAKGFRHINRQPRLFREAVHRRFSGFHPAPGRPGAAVCKRP